MKQTINSYDFVQVNDMKQTINSCDFVNAFRRYGRTENFSYEALHRLFDFFEELDKNIELDVIAICCDYNELSVDDIIREYSVDVDEDADEEERKEAAESYLQDNTCVVGETSTGFVFAVF